MPMSPGEILAGLRGSYRIETKHGEGSFGVTYRATDASTGVRVIVKELRIDRLDDWKALELFEREGEVLASLSHPNIPSFKDFFAHGGPSPLPVNAMNSYTGPQHLSLVLVQQFIEGATLQQRVDQGQRLSSGEAEPVLTALLQALRYLHERTPPLVHRDIKPGNVILTPDGQPYLVDFGAIQNRLTSAGSVGSTIVGTVGYMPLEQIRGDARPQSDLYALGVTMVVALAGKPLEQIPFDDDAGKIAVDRALPSVSGPLRAALGSMTAPLLGQRAMSAGVVLSELAVAHREAPRAGVPEPSPPPRPREPEPREERQRVYEDLFPEDEPVKREGPAFRLGRAVDAFGGVIGFGGFLVGVVGVPLLFAVMFLLRKSVLESAKDQFSKKFTCPLVRIEAHPRPYLHKADLDTPVNRTPPKDVAADPARLAVWQANQPKPVADNGDEIFELTGCDHHVLWSCHRGKSLVSCGYERDLGKAPPSRTLPGASASTSSSGQAQAGPAPDLEAGPVTITWNGRLDASTGVAPPIGTACVLSATVTSSGGRARESRLTFECKGQMLYDSNVPLSGVSDSMFDMGEDLVPDDAVAYHYFLGAKDIGSRSPPRSQIILYTPRGEVDVWRDTTSSFRVHAKIDKDSSVRRGKPLRSDAVPPFDDVVLRTARVTTTTGVPPFKTSSCRLRISPLNLKNRNCRVKVDCGGFVAYGAGTSGVNSCVIEDRRVKSMNDPDPTPKDGDPMLSCDLGAGTARLGDTSKSGVSYEVKFALAEFGDGGAR